MLVSAFSQQIKESGASRFGLLVVVLLISAAVAFGAVEMTRSSVQANSNTVAQTGLLGPPPPTVARPLLSGSQVSMAQATKTFGSPIVLPSTSAVQSSDVGPIWMSDVAGGTTVAVTFPSKGVWVSYDRAAPGDPASQVDPAQHYKDMSTALVGAQLVQLGGTTPAIYFPGNDGSGTNNFFFEANGAEIQIYGPFGERPLEAIAGSILSQLTSSPSSS